MSVDEPHGQDIFALYIDPVQSENLWQLKPNQTRKYWHKFMLEFEQFNS